MIKSVRLLTIFCCLTYVMSVTSFAQSNGGSNSGGGGTNQCTVYMDLIRDLQSKIYRNGIGKYQDVIDEILNQGLSQTMTGDSDREKIYLSLSLAAGMTLKCLPGKPEQLRGYQAWTQPSHVDPSIGAVTFLNVDAFEKMSEDQKRRFVLHELCILMGYERNGEYNVSSILDRIIKAVDSDRERNLKSNGTAGPWNCSMSYSPDDASWSYTENILQAFAEKQVRPGSKGRFVIGLESVGADRFVQVYILDVNTTKARVISSRKIEEAKLSGSAVTQVVRAAIESVLKVCQTLPESFLDHEKLKTLLRE